MKLIRLEGILIPVSLLCTALVTLAGSGWAQRVYTVAGGGGVGNGGPATSAALAHPEYAAYDKNGNLYIAERDDHRIRKVNANGIIKTIAGNGISGYSGDGGQAKSAKISFPTGLVMDGKGNLFFADNGNQRVRKIDPSGIITTVAGNGAPGYSGDGGPATAASLNAPWGLALHAGNLYIADYSNSVVRMVDTAGIIHTVAGNGTPGYSGDGGPATAAQLNYPEAAVLDGSGNLYIADTQNYRIRKVDNTGVITTFAGNGDLGCDGDGGPATLATIGATHGFVIKVGWLFVTTTACTRVRAVDLRTNIIATSMGTLSGYDGDGNPPSETRLRSPHGVLFDPAGNLLVVDSGNDRVRKLDSITQRVSTIAGGFIGDNLPATAAHLNRPWDVSLDETGNLYVADTGNERVRKADLSGNITTFAGIGITGYSGDGGPATQAQLQSPFALAADSSGTLYIGDNSGSYLRRVDQTGIITTFAQGGQGFLQLFGLATDIAGNIYGGDIDYCVVWKITPAALVSLVAGVPGSCGFNGDGIPATQAWLNEPWSVALDSHGNIYVADAGNNRIRKINHNTGLIQTTAGNGNYGFSGDAGPAKQAELAFPAGIATYAGQLYIADSSNARIRWVDTSGTIRTLAGTGNTGYNGEGLPGKKANLGFPVHVIVSPAGVVYYVDELQSRVRKIQ